MIESQQQPARVDYIDGLRAVACLFVLIFHAWDLAGSPSYRFEFFGHHPNPLRLFQFGATGVHLFLILSGFCLFLGFAATGGNKRFKVNTFASRRAWRILPAYYAVMAACLLLFPVHALLGRWTGLNCTTNAEPAGVTSVLLHLVLLQGLYPPYNWQINGPFWTLGLEWQYYMAFPVLVWLFHKKGPIIAFGTTLAITLGYRAVFHHLLRDSSGRTQWGIIASEFPGRAAEFGLGMWAAWQAKHAWPDRPVSRTVAWAELALAAGLAVCGMYSAGYTTFSDLYWGGCYFLLLKHVLRLRSWLRQWLSWRPLVWIGGISYSIYLIHVPVLELVRPFVLRQEMPIRGFVALGILGGTSSVVISAVFYRLFEAPFIRGRPRWLRAGEAARPELATASAIA